MRFYCAGAAGAGRIVTVCAAIDPSADGVPIAVIVSPTFKSVVVPVTLFKTGVVLVK